MDVKEFKQKYEELKDNPMYKNFCSILDTKNQVLERMSKENQELKKQLHESSLEIQHLIEQDIECPSNCSKLKELNKSLEASRRVAKYHLNRELDLKEVNQSLSKDLQKVTLKYNKWKKRYYTERRKNQELKEQLEVGEQQYNDLVEEKEELQEQLSNSHQIKVQQNEFIEYLNKYIKERRRLSKLHKEYSLSEERLSAQCHVLENVLLKYKEIVGGNNDQ